MALYLGSSENLKINLDNIRYCLNSCPKTSITNYVKLLSSNAYVLKDSNGLYLIAKEK